MNYEKRVMVNYFIMPKTCHSAIRVSNTPTTIQSLQVDDIFLHYTLGTPCLVTRRTAKTVWFRELMGLENGDARVKIDGLSLSVFTRDVLDVHESRLSVKDAPIYKVDEDCDEDHLVCYHWHICSIQLECMNCGERVADTCEECYGDKLIDE